MTSKITTNPVRRIRRTVSAAVIGAAVLVGCGGDSDTDTAGSITVTGQWARTSPAATTMGAAYMTITSPVDDALVSVSVSADVAGEAQIHETVMDHGDMGDMGDGMDHDSSMTMREIDSLALPAGTAVVLEPGGHHVMLMALVAPLTEGDEFELTLSFESGATVTVTVPVRSSAP